jgi:hypothetical protein
MTIKCFLLTPTGNERRWLRRYRGCGDGPNCPSKYTYHNGHFLLGDFPKRDTPRAIDVEEYKGHANWPVKCDHCDYQFKPEDNWQVFTQHLYIRSDTHEVTSIREAPPGAMWLATWMKDHGSPVWERERKGQPHLIVRTPEGDWDVDAKSSNGDGWHWEGTPPLVTVSPSIGMGPTAGSWRYHAWLRNGELIDC